MSFNVTASAPVSPGTTCPGIAVNSFSSSHTLGTTDRAAALIFTSGIDTLTLCQITGTCANSFAFVVMNETANDLTITANAADTINGGSLAGSALLPSNWIAFVYSDTAQAPGNWHVLRLARSSALPAVTMCSQGPQSAITGNGSAQNVWSCTIPASMFAVGHSLQANFTFKQTLGANSVTYAIKLGNTQIVGYSSSATTNIYQTIACVITGTNAETCTGSAAQTGSAFVPSSQPGAINATETTASASSISVTFNVGSGSAVTPQVELVTAQ